MRSASDVLPCRDSDGGNPFLARMTTDGERHPSGTSERDCESFHRCSVDRPTFEASERAVAECHKTNSGARTGRTAADASAIHEPRRASNAAVLMRQYPAQLLMRGGTRRSAAQCAVQQACPTAPRRPRQRQPRRRWCRRPPCGHSHCTAGRLCESHVRHAPAAAGPARNDLWLLTHPRDSRPAQRRRRCHMVL